MPKISPRPTASRTAPSPVPSRYRAGTGVEPLCLRIPAACAFVGISRSKLYELIASGEIETVKLGTATLVLTASLRALIEALRVAIPGCHLRR
jgi:excisionase family DNA binding protein